METHFGILVWEIPWTEESGGPWGHKESDTTELLIALTLTYGPYALNLTEDLQVSMKNGKLD